MALNPETKYPGRITASDANYDYGSSKDETAPGAGDGTPYEKARANDVFGLQQALLKISGIVPSGNADTQLASQYAQALIELAMGRATNYDDSGAADAYVLDVQTDQQAPASLFDGMIAEFIVGNTNTGASTVDLVALGVKNIVGTDAGGELTAGERVKIRYRISTGDFEIVIAPESVLPGFIFGLESSHAADADHDVTIGSGQATDSTNAFSMSLGSAITKQTDAAWVAGNNVGGLFSGTVAADTVYYRFIIRKDSDGSIDAGYDISDVAANIPAGYTAFVAIGYLWTDGSANILGLTDARDDGKIHSLVTPLPTISGTSIDIPFVPSWVKKIKILLSGVSTNGTSQVMFQLGDSGGVEITGYLGSNAFISSSTTGTGAMSSGFSMQGASAARIRHGILDIALIDNANNTWSALGTFGHSDAAEVLPLAGSKALTAALTQLRLTTFNGTDVFDAGEINFQFEG